MATSPKSGDKPVKPTAATTARKPAVKTKAAATPAAKAKPAAASKAPKAAKSTAPAKTAKPVASAAKSAKASKASGAANILAPDQRRYYIEVAAYYIAERRGFHGGNEVEDWAAAEAEVDRLLREGVLNP